MLSQVIVTAKLLATARIRAFVRFLVGVNASDVSLEMLTPSEAFPAPADVTEVDASAQRCISLATSRVRGSRNGYSASPRLLRKIWDGDRDRERPGVLPHLSRLSR